LFALYLKYAQKGKRKSRCARARTGGREVREWSISTKKKAGRGAQPKEEKMKKLVLLNLRVSKYRGI